MPTTAANPLLQIQFQIPFDQIRAENVEPAIEELLQQTREELDRLTSEPGARTFDNTLQRLDQLTERLDYAMQIVRNLEAVATTPELRAAYNAAQPKVSEFYSSLPLNEALWQAVLSYSRTEEASALTGVRKRFLEKTMDNFRRHGAELNAEGKKRIAEIDVELTKQTIRFAENVLDSTNQYEWVITDESRLAGLPESARAMARASAASKGLPEPSWRFTLQAPSYLAVMTYLDDEEMRRQVYEAFVNRATEEKYDNRPIHAQHSGIARRKGAAAGVSRLCRSGAGRPHGPRRRSRAAVPGRFKAQNRNAFRKGKRRFTGLLRKSGIAALGYRLLRGKTAQPRSMISMRRRCGPTSRWRA